MRLGLGSKKNFPTETGSRLDLESKIFFGRDCDSEILEMSGPLKAVSIDSRLKTNSLKVEIHRDY